MSQNILLRALIFTMIGLLLSLTWSRAEAISANRSVSEKAHLKPKIGAVFGVSTISMIKLFKEKSSFGDNVSTVYKTITSPD